MASVSIKRGTKQVIDNTSLKDGRVYFTTDQPINKIYTDIPDGQGGLERITIGGGTEVDSELSITSTNPVQNKVITEEVDEVRGQIHTNLLNPPIGTTTIYGVEFKANGDGTYTANGTASSEIWFNYIGEKKPISYFGIKNDGTKYRFTGCPDGGSSTTYRCDVYTYTDETPEHLIHGYVETGNGQTFSLGSTEVQIGFGVRVKKNAVLDNVVFKPMLTTDTSSDYDSFTEYSGNKKRLNEQVASLHESSKGLITNLLNYKFDSTTKNGITITNNRDGTYTLTGTASAFTNFMVLPYTKGEKVKKGKYKLVGCPKGGGANKYNIWMCESSHGSDIDNLVEEYGDGVICNFEGAKSIHVEIRVISGTALPSGGITFKPMLTTDLDATYNDYVPYSGDGRLNENVAEIYNKVEKNTEDIATHTDEISQINADLSVTSENISTGVTLFRSGSNRMLAINFAVIQNVTIPVNDRPQTPIFTCGMIGQGGHYQVGIISVESNGVVTAHDSNYTKWTSNTWCTVNWIV